MRGRAGKYPVLEGREASRMPAAAAHTPAQAFQTQAGARSSLLGTEPPWLLLVFYRAKGSEDGGRGRTVCPSMAARLSCVGTGTATSPFQGARSFVDPVKQAIRKGRKTGYGRSAA